MAKPLRVLIVEDNEDDALLLVNRLKNGGYKPTFERVDTCEGLRSALSRKEWDCILSDYSMPQFNGLAALREAREYGADIPFILVSGTIGEESAVEAMKAGAHDYIMKDKLMRLIPALERELADAEIRRKQKRAEQALRESEDRYRDLVQHSSDLMCTHDLQGNILSVNPAAARFSGYSEAELLTMNLRDLLAPQVRDGFQKYLAEIQAKGTSNGVMLVQSKSGEMRLWAYKNSLRTRENAAAIVRGTARDITEDKRAKKALQERESYLTAIIENQPGLMWLKDTEGRFLAVNQAFAVSCGKQTPEDVVGETDLDVWPRDLAEKYRADDAQVMRTGRSTVVEELVYDQGEAKWFETFKTPVRDAHGNIIGTTGYAHDITGRRRTEQMLRQAQKVEAIGQLAGGVAHDFNNILMAITGYCELILLKTPPEDPLHASVLEIQKAANQGASLTRQLLAFSRKQILEPRVLKLNDVIKNMEGMLRRLLRENIALKLNLKGDLCHVRADQGQIEQVIMNLAVNSGDAMPAGGTLKLETSNVTVSQGIQAEGSMVPPGNYVAISVQDSGIGMDEATRARIFEPFFTTKEQGKGTGLGLSTVYGIVKQSEGYIVVESTPGHGTTFTIYLPRLEGQEKSPVAADSPSTARLPRGSGSVLLVDDNGSIRHAVAALLEMCGYRVLQASNGEEGLNVIDGHADGIDLVITDVVMPRMGGPELVKQLAANRPGIKVIYMSGYSEEAAALRSRMPANSAYLQKPANMQTLLRTIRDLLDAKNAT